MFCKNCGSQIKDNMPFCPDCGAKQVKKPAPAASTASPAALTPEQQREAKIRELSAQQAQRNASRRAASSPRQSLSDEFGNGLYGQNKAKMKNPGGGKGLGFLAVLALIAAAVVLILFLTTGKTEGVWLLQGETDYIQALVVSPDGTLYGYGNQVPYESGFFGPSVTDGDRSMTLRESGDVLTQTIKENGESADFLYDRLPISSTDGIEGAWYSDDGELFLADGETFYGYGYSAPYTDASVNISGVDYQVTEVSSETLTLSGAGETLTLRRIY